MDITAKTVNKGPWTIKEASSGTRKKDIVEKETRNTENRERNRYIPIAPKNNNSKMKTSQKYIWVERNNK